MLTRGSDTPGTGLDEANHLALGKGVLLAGDLHIHHIARHAEGHENDERGMLLGSCSHVEETLALSGNCLYNDIL